MFVFKKNRQIVNVSLYWKINLIYYRRHLRLPLSLSLSLAQTHSEADRLWIWFNNKFLDRRKVIGFRLEWKGWWSCIILVLVTPRWSHTHLSRRRRRCCPQVDSKEWRDLLVFVNFEIDAKSLESTSSRRFDIETINNRMAFADMTYIRLCVCVRKTFPR